MSDISLKITSDSSQARQDLSRLSQSVSNIEAQTIKSTKSLASLGKQIGAAFAGFAGISAVVRLTDSLINLENRIALVTGRTKELIVVQKELFRLSFRTGTQVAANVAIYNKFGLSLRKVGIDSTNILRATETIAQTIKLSGSSAESANAAIIQLGQGLASGTLRGEELNSVLEQLPRLAQAIADELKVGVGELRALAEQGKLTSATVFKAIRNQAGVISKEFETLNSTIGTATTRLGLAFSFLLSVLNRSTNFSKLTANLINAFAESVFKFAERLPVRLQIITNDFSYFYRKVKYFLQDLSNEFENLFKAATNKFGINFDFLSVNRATKELEQLSRKIDELFNFSVDLNKVKSQINKVFALIYATFQGSLSGFYSSLTKVISTVTTDAVFKGLLNNSVSLLQAGLAFLSNSADVIANRISNVYDVLFNSALPAKVRIGLAFKEAFNLTYLELFEFYNNYTKIIDSIFDSFDSISNYVISIDLSTYLPSLDQVKSKLKSFYDFVIGIFYKIYDLVVGNSYWPDTLDGILNYTQEIIPKVIATLNSFANKVLNKFKSIYESVSQLNISIKVTDFIAQVKEDITKNLTFENLVAQVNKLYNSFRKFFSGLSFNRISQVSSKIFDQFKSFFTNIKDVSIPVVTVITTFLAVLASSTGPFGKLVGFLTSIKDVVRESPTTIKEVFTEFTDSLGYVGTRLNDFIDRVLNEPKQVALDIEKAFSEGLINSSAFTGLSDLFAGIIGRAFGRATGNEYGWKENLTDGVAAALLFAFNSTFRRVVTISAIIKLAKGDRTVSEFLQDILDSVANFGNKVLKEAGVIDLLGIEQNNRPLGLLAGLLFGSIGLAFFSKTVRSFLFGLLKIDFEAKRIRDALADVLGPQTGKKIATGLQSQTSTIAKVLRGFVKLGSIAGGVGGLLGSIYVSEFIKKTLGIEDPFKQLAVDLGTAFVGAFLGSKALSFLGTTLASFLIDKLKIVDTTLSKGGISFGKRFALALRTGILSSGLFGGFLAGYLVGDFISDALGIEGTFNRLGVSIASAILGGFIGYQLASKLSTYVLFTVLPLLRKQIAAAAVAIGIRLATGLFSVAAIKTALGGLLATLTGALSLPVILSALGIAAGASLLYLIFFGEGDGFTGKVRSFFDTVKSEIKEVLGIPEKAKQEKAAKALADKLGNDPFGFDSSEALTSIAELNRLAVMRSVPSGPTSPLTPFDTPENVLRNAIPNATTLEPFTTLNKVIKEEVPELSSELSGLDTSVTQPVNTLSNTLRKLNDTLININRKSAAGGGGSGTLLPNNVISPSYDSLSNLPQSVTFGQSKDFSQFAPSVDKLADITNKALTILAPQANANIARDTFLGRNVNRPLNVLGELVARGESTGSGGYTAVAGRRKGLSSLTNLSIEEILAQQDKGKLGAVGRYQFIEDTLRETAKAAGINLTEKFSPEIQDRLFEKLFDQRVLSKIKGKPLTDEVVNEALINLAKVWAAVPVPEQVFRPGTKEYAARTIMPGESYYQGVGTNKATLDVETLKLALIEVLKANKFASGGYISGAGGSRSDLIPAMLSNGEYVINAAATKKFGPILDAINSGKLFKFNNGGEVLTQLQSSFSNVSTVLSGSENKIIADLLLRVKTEDIDTRSLKDITTLFKQIGREKENIKEFTEELQKALDVDAEDYDQDRVNELQKRLRSARDTIEQTVDTISNRLKDFTPQTPEELSKLFKKEQGEFVKAQVQSVKESLQSGITELLSGKTTFAEFGKQILNNISLEIIKGFSKGVTDQLFGGDTGGSFLSKAFSGLFGGNLETGNTTGSLLSGLFGGSTKPDGTIGNPINVVQQTAAIGDAFKVNVDDNDPMGLDEYVGDQSSIFDKFTSSISGLFSKDNPLLKGLGGIFGSLFGGSGGGLGGLLSSGLKFLGLPGFADGGVIPGSSGSAVPVLAHAGEIILNETQQARVAAAMQNGSSGQQVINLNITGDISRQTKSEIYRMLPSIAEGVNSHNREKGYRG